MQVITKIKYMKSNSLIGILSITGLFLITLCACNSSTKKEDKPMNVIYIMADDHAYQAGCKCIWFTTQ